MLNTFSKCVKSPNGTARCSPSTDMVDRMAFTHLVFPVHPRNDSHDWQRRFVEVAYNTLFVGGGGGVSSKKNLFPLLLLWCSGNDMVHP